MSLPGYQQPGRYDIVACDQCNTRWAWPLVSDRQIYDSIYRHADRIPGYRSYFARAEEVLQVADPLEYLGWSSPVYWAVAKYLQESWRDRRPRVLEFGCGLGYLTYALSKRGYDVCGLDISADAVAKAQRQYGPRFICGDIRQSGTRLGRYDVVLATEVLEHVENPRSVLQHLRHLLAPGGELMVTVPNRDAYPQNTVWDAELPPVHLWWFSASSLRALAVAEGFSAIRFLDFSDCPVGWAYLRAKFDYSRPTQQPFLDAQGRPCCRADNRLMRRLAHRAARATGWAAPLRRWRHSLLGRRQRISAGTQPDGWPRPHNLCAILVR